MGALLRWGRTVVLALWTRRKSQAGKFGGAPTSVDHREIAPLSLGETRAVLAAAAGQRNSVRSMIALVLGLRQGEALGLQWDDIDLERSTLSVRRALQRSPWRHGCPRQACGRPAYRCPNRYGGGLGVVSPKSATSVRTIVLPHQLVVALDAHRRSQLAERHALPSRRKRPPTPEGLHSGSGWVFDTHKGAPIDPARDWKAWKDLLADAGVRDARLHDARHTAATFLLIAGVNARTTMDLMGSTQPMMLTRYQHVADPLKQDAAERIETLLWGSAV